MPTVTPPSTTSTSVAPPNLAASGVTPVEAGVGNAPDKIAQLARQIQVSGLITQPPVDGEISLNTIIGNLTIVLPQLAKDQQDKLMNQLLALFEGQKPLTVVVQPGDPPSQAFLLLPPYAPATNTANTSPLSVQQDNVLLQTSTVPQTPTVTPGTVLSAVVLQPNTVTASANTGLPPGIPLPQSGAPTPDELALLTGSTFLNELAAKAEALANQIIPEAQARILLDAYQAPTQQAGLPPLPQQQPGIPLLPPEPGGPQNIVPQTIVLRAPEGPSSLPPTIPAAVPQTPTAPLQAVPAAPQVQQSFASQQVPAPVSLSSLFQPGAEVDIQVNAVSLPGTLLPIPTSSNQVIATVTGNGPGGQLLVQAGDTTLYVKTSVNAPVGSSLLVTVTAARPQELVPLPLLDDNNFGALQQALAALTQADPQLARQVMENVIPQPNAALGGTLLFLLSAFGKSDVRGWLGNNAIDILTRAGKMELIARLTQQLREGGQTVSDPVVGAWRSYTVPLQANNQFQTLQMYVHSEGQGGGKGKETGKPGTNAVRFLIDMRLSKLGALQLDGFVRPKQMDMIVRSEKLLPDGLNQELRQTYIKAMDAVGYAGTLNFQTGRQHWMNLRKASTGSMVM